MLTVPTRLGALLQREFGATEALLVGPGERAAFEEEGRPTAAADAVRGHRVVILLAEWPADLDAIANRLAMLVGSFADLLEAAVAASSRPAITEVLHRELRDLAGAAGALDALVIDAQSDVVWASADSDDTAPHVVRAPAEVIALDGRHLGDSAPPPSASERAIYVVRSLPAMDGAARGTPFAHHDREGEVPLLARSFGTIYVLVLVFDAPFDEIRAEREVKARIDVVERLVLALPPIDPEPTRGAKAARRPG